MEEYYKPLESYEDFYEISNKGKIRSLHLRCYQKEMKLELDRSEYLTIRLNRFGIRKKHAVHILVYTNFHGPVLPGNIIHHVDERKLNNTDNNLIQLTPSDHRLIHNRTVYVSL